MVLGAGRAQLLVMVFFAAPVTRTVARMLMPSHKQLTICARCWVIQTDPLPPVAVVGEVSSISGTITALSSATVSEVRIEAR